MEIQSQTGSLPKIRRSWQADGDRGSCFAMEMAVHLPDKNIATINYVDVPVNKPFEFYITSDAPMSALFIPQLGSQIYAMAGMRTRLNLISSHIGVYDGLDTQYNGKGFSSMHFKVHVTSQKTFDQWVHHVKESADSKPLTVSSMLSYGSHGCRRTNGIMIFLTNHFFSVQWHLIYLRGSCGNTPSQI